MNKRAWRDLFILSYDPKPVLVHKQGEKIVRRIPYAEAIDKFANLLDFECLKTAKKIAGKQYGQRFHIVFGIAT